MVNEIVNRVAKSNLIILDLEDYYPSGKRTVLDLKVWLFQGLILKEKEFRIALQNFDWVQFHGHHIALQSSTEAIIPAWAFMLVQTYLSGIAKTTVIGSLEQLESNLYKSLIEHLDLSFCKDRPVILKGCSSKPVPQNAYLYLIEKLQPIASSIMYGEACSSVPLYKRKNKI